MGEEYRRAALVGLVESLYMRVDQGIVTHLDVLTQAVDAAIGIARLDMGSNSPGIAKTVIGDLQAVFVGNGLWLGRGEGDYWIGNVVGINDGRRGASGFEDKFVDRTDQVQHAIGGLIGSYEYGAFAEWITQLREREDPDFEINIRTFLIGNILDDYNIDELSTMLRAALQKVTTDGFAGPKCFLAGTQVSMWDGTKKPIELVEAGDLVVSYDKDGTLKPGRVKRTMTNRSRQILDVHGLMVTPGHVTLCGDGKFNGQHVPIIDILRSDGALVREDGSKIRAATGCPLGSLGDRMIAAIVGTSQPDGRVKIAEVGQIRLGTRFIMDDGEDVSVLDLIAQGGGAITEDGMVTRGRGPRMPFRWTFTPNLPKPEDYVLQRSATHLQDICQANEWEAVRPMMPTPSQGEAGPSLSRHPAMMSATPANIPLSLRRHPEAPHMSRKYRRAADARSRKAGVSLH